MKAATIAWRGLELGALAGIGYGVWRAYQQLMAIRQDGEKLLAESLAARLERTRRAQNDEVDIYEARLVLHALETLGECQPCREQLDRIRERSKRWAPAPEGYTRDGSTLRKL